MNLSAALSTIFSIVCAAPPPFIKFKLLSTSSAPSTAMSIECSSREVSGIPLSFASKKD